MPFYCDIAVFSGERFTKGKQYAKKLRIDVLLNSQFFRPQPPFAEKAQRPRILQLSQPRFSSDSGGAADMPDRKSVV